MKETKKEMQPQPREELQFDGEERKKIPNLMVRDRWMKKERHQQKQKLPHAYYWSNRDT
jgi:hypothetical protein